MEGAYFCFPGTGPPPKELLPGFSSDKKQGLPTVHPPCVQEERSEAHLGTSLGLISKQEGKLQEWLGVGTFREAPAQTGGGT